MDCPAKRRVPCLRSNPRCAPLIWAIAMQVLSSMQLSTHSAVHRCAVTAASGEEMVLSIAMCREERHQPSYRSGLSMHPSTVAFLSRIFIIPVHVLRHACTSTSHVSWHRLYGREEIYRVACKLRSRTPHMTCRCIPSHICRGLMSSKSDLRKFAVYKPLKSYSIQVSPLGHPHTSPYPRTAAMMQSD